MEKIARYVTNSLRAFKNSLDTKNSVDSVGVNYYHVVLFALLGGHGRLVR